MAFDQTLQNITNSVLTKLSMEYGTSVQPYAERRIKAYIQDVFDLIFYKRYWSQFSSWQTGTLDGVTGVVTSDLTSVLLHWNDLQKVVKDKENVALPSIIPESNPYTLTGTTPKYVAPLATVKIFKIYPVTSVGNIQFYIRTKPSNFIDTDVINFDSMALIYGTTYLYAEDDATNLGAVDKFKGLFELRVKQLELEDDQHISKLANSDYTVPYEWH